MTECENCDTVVSNNFVKVYGSNDGNIYRCMNCTTRPVLRNGGGAIKDLDEIENRMHTE